MKFLFSYLENVYISCRQTAGFGIINFYIKINIMNLWQEFKWITQSCTNTCAYTYGLVNCHFVILPANIPLRDWYLAPSKHHIHYQLHRMGSGTFDFTGNIRADRAAKEATSVTPVSKLYTPPNDFLNAVRFRIALCDSSVQYINTIVPAWNHIIFCHTAVVICGVRTSHTRLTYDFIFKNANPPSCLVCNVPLKITHIFPTCSKYNPFRSSLSLSSLSSI